MFDMRRREFITLFGGAAASWPLTVQAQQPAGIRVIGFLSSGSPDAYTQLLAAFREGLAETGYVETRSNSASSRALAGQVAMPPA